MLDREATHAVAGDASHDYARAAAQEPVAFFNEMHLDYNVIYKLGFKPINPAELRVLQNSWLANFNDRSLHV